jgi:hypothetical protein
MTRTLLLTLLLLALVAPGAQASTGPLWATVNVCKASVVGMRASVPGDGGSSQQFVRFSAQWWSQLKRDWLPVGGSPDSPWLAAGSGRSRWSQAGWSFSIQPSPPGAVFLIRGIARIQWRDGGRVLRSTTRVTRGGMPGVLAADPVGTSRGSCSLP